jgi:hypothetical protein
MVALHERPRQGAHVLPTRKSHEFEQQDAKSRVVQAAPSGLQQIPPASQTLPPGHCPLAVQGAQAFPMQAGVGFAQVVAAQQRPVTQPPAQHRSPVPEATQSAVVAQGHAPQSTVFPHSFC